MATEAMYFTYAVAPDAQQSVPRLLAQLLTSIDTVVSATHALDGSSAPRLVPYRWRPIDDVKVKLGSPYPLYRRASQRLKEQNVIVITTGAAVEVRRARPKARVIHWVHSGTYATAASTLNLADVVVTPSQSLCNDLGCPPHSRVIHNWVDTVTFHSSRQATERAEVRAGWGVDSDELVIVHAGGDKAKKGADLVQRELVDSGVQAVFVRCGSAQPGVERFGSLTVVKIGRLEPPGLAALYRAADIGVVPSQYPDPYPTVVLEMLATGLPVIGAEIGGIPEMLAANPAGLLVPRSGSWARAIASAGELDASAGPKWIAEHATLERAAAEWLSVLSEHAPVARSHW